METVLWVVLLLAAVSRRVTGALTITPTYDTYYLIAPSVLELTCSSTGSGSVSWVKDGTTLTNGVNGYVIDSSLGTLTKSSTSTSDSGSYQCSEGSDTLSMNVQIFSVTTTSGNYTSSSTPITLMCEPTFSGTAPSYTMTWKRADSVDISDTTAYTRVSADNSLLITSPKFTSTTDDSGEYHCGFSFPTTPPQERSASVYVYAGPQVKSFGLSVTFTEGDTTTLDCTVFSYPTANITWRLENATISNERIVYNSYNGYSNGQLSIPATQKSDRGNYMCYAFNEQLGTSANKTVLLRVKDRLAWLWPLIGIIAELVVLLLIVLAANYKCPKTKPSAAAAADNSEPQPGTSNTSPSSVRKRTTNL